MERIDIIDKIGRQFHTSNLENGEFSYKQVLKKIDCAHYKLDLRFEKNNLSILVETKKKKKHIFSDNEVKQLDDYVELEKKYKKNNHIVSILYNLYNDKCSIYYDGVKSNDEKLNDIVFYENKFKKNIKNDRRNVLKATIELNKQLHSFGIEETSRSQLVGSFLIALNNDLEYSNQLSVDEILSRIKKIIEKKINDDGSLDAQNKEKEKAIIGIFKKKNIKDISKENLISLLDRIKEEIIPNIDLREPYGEDLLNLCFTTFNKYANKKNKNQIFTPPHITDFMCDIVSLTPNSHVLDPTCGSGSFLVQAMYKMMSKVANDDVDKKKSIKTSQLFGIELDDNSFGLAVTNMLMHRDGKSNIINDSCFKDNIKRWIENKKIDIVLMNPPFGAPKSNLHEECPVSRSGMDATKGLYFVYYIAKIVEKGYLATILPLQCAEVTNNTILEYKEKILKNNSLVACFTLPKDLFYPAASTESCIMLFKLGTPHCNYDKGTFFASCKDDGFVKSKKLGRIENKSWNTTKKKWLDSFHKMEIIKEFSSVKKVNYSDTWLAEAYMDIDYSKLNDQTFIQTIRDYISYKVKVGKINND